MTEPIACSLTADQYAHRTAEASDLARRALRERRPLPGGARLIFDADTDTARELRALVTAEAQCCPFLRMDLDETEGGLQLDVTGPEDAQPIIAEIFT
jgi:hypothetical protein